MSTTELPDTRKRKKLLFVRRTNGFGGVEIILLDWLKKIDYSRYEVFVSSPVDVFSQRISECGVPATFVRLNAQEITHVYGRYQPEKGINDLVKLSFWHFFPIWLRFMWRIKPDIVIFLDGDFFITPLACVLAAFIVSRGNVSMTIHSPSKLQKPPEPKPKTSRKYFGIPGLGLWWYRQVWWPLWPWRARGTFSRRILTVSRAIGERVVGFYGYPRHKMGLVRHGVDTLRFQPCPSQRKCFRSQHGISDGAFVIASTCRLSYEKNVDWVINAFNSVASHNAGVWLVLAGDGPLRDEIHALVSTCPTRERILFLGHVADVCPVLQAADAYVLASSFEGSPIALMEAMAVGLVCLMSRIPGPDEIIEHGRDGILIEPSEEGVATGLAMALAMPRQELERMGVAAREKAVAEYGLEKAVESAFSELGIETTRLHGANS